MSHPDLPNGNPAHQPNAEPVATKVDEGLFALGKLLATPAALEHLSQAGVSPLQLLEQHALGDWGDINANDARENEYALEHPLRIVSAYVVGSEKMLIITEADRSHTTLLLISEY